MAILNEFTAIDEIQKRGGGGGVRATYPDVLRWLHEVVSSLLK